MKPSDLKTLDFGIKVSGSLEFQNSFGGIEVLSRGNGESSIVSGASKFLATVGLLH